MNLLTKVTIGAVLLVSALAGVKAIIHTTGHKLTSSHPATSAAPEPQKPTIAPLPSVAVAVAPTAPASATSTPLPPPPPPAPPTGVQAGWINQTTSAQDQFNQWVKVDARTVQQPTLNLTAPPPPAGSQGARRTTWAAWIHTDAPATTLALRVADGRGEATATVDGWTSAPADIFFTGAPPSSQETVVNLAAGWHQVTVTVERPADAFKPLDVELELGSPGADPAAPAPFAVPPAASKPAASSTAPKPAAAATVASRSHE